MYRKIANGLCNSRLKSGGTPRRKAIDRVQHFPKMGNQKLPEFLVEIRIFLYFAQYILNFAANFFQFFEFDFHFAPVPMQQVAAQGYVCHV